jgi:hypothetical protein
MGAVIGRGSGEAGVAHQRTRGLVIAHVVDGRRGKHNVGTHLPQDFHDAAARGVVAEHGQVAELRASILGADEAGGVGAFLAPYGRDLIRCVVVGTAVAGRHADNDDAVPGRRQHGHRAPGQDLDVVGMGVDG